MPESEIDLCRRSAIDQLAALASGELSARELLHETRRRHAEANPVINAVVTTDFAAAERAADASDRRRAAGPPARPLEGLPVAVKDLEDTAGMRSTYGSTLHAEHVPQADSLLVARLRAAGAVIYGKTNTPEFGTGSHTYNGVFGTTTNPYDPTRSAGGSSGGAAAALAAGLSSVADGSDMGGSLRNPASFCNVVGFRPSMGRVPNWPVTDAWDTLATNGPMGRTVGDAALLLSAISGGDDRAPLAFPEPLAAAPETAAAPLRIGWSRTLGGLDIEPEVTAVLDGDGLPELQRLGHALTDVEPELAEADAAFRVLRGLNYARSFGHLLAEHRDALSPELTANVEFGERLTIADYFEAREQRTRVYRRMLELFSRIDVLAAPVTAVLPFDARTTWPREINGIAQPDYLEWMRASWRITVTGFAAISVPCGFSDTGLPVGLQLIAPPRHEDRLLAVAAAFERARPVWRETPRVLAAASSTHTSNMEVV
ncbi:amidase family protein [Leucobacter allii]|uniref:Amidase family protein n=1 Tax=Leucobacter allii TaxID=2932247 RepID=A0ABY4FPV1_9MICO|nr:amidase family protein [Leucobacter allii]UOQ58309.1 amidase family protein [Leucobacter allii]